VRVLTPLSEDEVAWVRFTETAPITGLRGERCTVLFEKRRLSLCDHGEHCWTIPFPAELRAPTRNLFIEEHGFSGISRNAYHDPVVKVVCACDGTKLSALGTGSDENRYVAPSLVTLSCYGDGAETVTIKQMRVIQIAQSACRLIIWVSRCPRYAVVNDASLRRFAPVMKLAEAELLGQLQPQRGEK